MPIFTVTLTETLNHRIIIEAPTEAQAMRAAETFLTENDHNDRYLFSASDFEASCATPAATDAKPDLITEDAK